YEFARTDYAFMLMSWRWPKEARKQLEISLALAPSKATIYCWIGHAYRAERDYTNAIAWYRKTLQYRPRHAWAYGGLKETYEALHDYESSIENAKEEDLAHGGDPIEVTRTYDSLRRAFHERGERGYYEQEWERTKENLNAEYYWKARIQ